ncbi:MAG: hypothetical protein DLM72_02815 [Candidatus Nitrosopolaris wilkensis]|nr:MAG: hypothetical protein DLM72_02815 [Candidatus Nitrosopolaris wilkensis]
MLSIVKPTLRILKYSISIKCIIILLSGRADNILENYIIDEARTKDALIIHDDLNPCGGSERLAATTIQCLTEIGFNVDLATFKMPAIIKIQKLFGIDLTNRIRKILFTNLHSILNMEEQLLNKNIDGYDLVINTHGDLLPFYEKHNGNAADPKGKNSKINITYCHYPLLPYQIRNGTYRIFLEKYIQFIASHSTVNKLFANAFLVYNLMMNNSFILTNSTFSARAIKQLYDNIQPITLSPPVDVDKFRKATLPYYNKQNILLVVSRFSPDKQIENALILANLLKDKCSSEKIQKTKMIIAGNTIGLDYKYVQLLEEMILDYGLQNYVKLVSGASFDQLLYMMRKSKIYFHPLAGEPFGISIVEAMASGLIPVVPASGGSIEFVPSEYQYHNIQEAADIVSKLLIQSKDATNIGGLESSLKISSLVSRFSIQSYKNNLENIINSLLKTRGVEEPVILNQPQKRV